MAWSLRQAFLIGSGSTGDRVPQDVNVRVVDGDTVVALFEQVVRPQLSTERRRRPIGVVGETFVFHALLSKVSVQSFVVTTAANKNTLNLNEHFFSNYQLSQL